jgi:hypothetical protein
LTLAIGRADRGNISPPYDEFDAEMVAFAAMMEREPALQGGLRRDPQMRLSDSPRESGIDPASLTAGTMMQSSPRRR